MAPPRAPPAPPRVVLLALLVPYLAIAQPSATATGSGAATGSGTATATMTASGTATASRTPTSSNPLSIGATTLPLTPNGVGATLVNSQPTDIVVHPTSGVVFVSTFNSSRLISFPVGGGTIQKTAGTGAYSYSGDGGAATSAALNSPVGLAVHPVTGSLYFADAYNLCVRRITFSSSNYTGTISSYAGVCTPTADGAGDFGGDNGPASSALLSKPLGIAFSPSGGALYICDSGNVRVRSVNTVTGVITSYLSSGSGGAASSIVSPAGVAVDAFDSVYMSDQSSSQVYRKTLAGVVTVYAGSTVGYSGDYGSPTSAKLRNPTLLAMSIDDDLLIADTGNSAVRVVYSSGPQSGQIVTVAGTGVLGNTQSTLAAAWGVASTSTGLLLVADSLNQRIQQVRSPIPSASSTPSGTGSSAITPSAHATPTTTAASTGSSSITPSFTVTPSVTPPPTESSTASMTPSSASTVSPSVSGSPAPSTSPSSSVTKSGVGSPPSTPSVSQSVGVTKSSTATPTPSATPTPLRAVSSVLDASGLSFRSSVLVLSRELVARPAPFLLPPASFDTSLLAATAADWSFGPPNLSTGTGGVPLLRVDCAEPVVLQAELWLVSNATTGSSAPPGLGGGGLGNRAYSVSSRAFYLPVDYSSGTIMPTAGGQSGGVLNVQSTLKARQMYGSGLSDAKPTGVLLFPGTVTWTLIGTPIRPYYSLPAGSVDADLVHTLTFVLDSSTSSSPLALQLPPGMLRAAYVYST